MTSFRNQKKLSMHKNGGYVRSIDVIVHNSHKELPWETMVSRGLGAINSNVDNKIHSVLVHKCYVYKNLHPGSNSYILCIHTQQC